MQSGVAGGGGRPFDVEGAAVVMKAKRPSEGSGSVLLLVVQ